MGSVEKEKAGYLSVTNAISHNYEPVLLSGTGSLSLKRIFAVYFQGPQVVFCRDAFKILANARLTKHGLYDTIILLNYVQAKFELLFSSESKKKSPAYRGRVTHPHKKHVLGFKYMDYRDYRKKYSKTHPDGSARPDTVPQRSASVSRTDGSRSVRQTDTVDFGSSREKRTRTKTGIGPAGFGKKNRYGYRDPAAGSGRGILIAIVTLTVLLVAVIAILILSSTTTRLPNYVASRLTVEAGRSSISPTDFLTDQSHSAEFASNSSFSLDHVGIYKIKLIIDGKKYTTSLRVTDTVAPTGTAIPVTVRRGGSVKASDCVIEVKDATDVEVSFRKTPDLSSVGTVKTVLVLKDEGGNESQLDGEITVVDNLAVINTVKIIECGSAVPSVKVFVGNDGEGEYVTDVTSINTYEPGFQTLAIRVGAGEYNVTLICKDTTPPTATVTPQTIKFGSPLPEAAAFVSNIVDVNPVSVSYVSQPINNGQNPIRVKIRVTDSSGNYTVYDSTITFANDNEPPEIVVLNDRIDMDVGDSAIIWRSCITVTDNSGQEPLVILDLSGADTTQSGTYTVYFVASDSSGNVSRRPAVLTVHDSTVTQEMLNEAVRNLCTKIFKDNMSILDKMNALYTYLSANAVGQLQYNGSIADHDDWRREAYLSLTSRKTGDCFSFASVAHAVFTYLGYDCLMVERAKAYQTIGTHFWNMINLGTDANPSWYHFDATPMRGGFRIKAYALTDAQLDAYTKWRDDLLNPQPHYYMYEKTLYPVSSSQIIVNASIPAKYFN